MDLSVFFHPGECIYLHCVEAVEYAYIKIRVALLQLSDEFLDLFSLADRDPGSRILCESAGALEERKVIVLCPSDYVIFPDAVQRPDKFHSFKVFAVKFGHHGGHL